MPSNRSRNEGNTESSAEISAREASITGKPPRLLPLDPSEFGQEASEIVAALRRTLSSAATDEVPELIATLLRHPALFRRFIELALQLLGGALPAATLNSRSCAQPGCARHLTSGANTWRSENGSRV